MTADVFSVNTKYDIYVIDELFIYFFRTVIYTQIEW